MVDDFAVEGDDDGFFGADFDYGGDVLVGLVLRDGDSLAEQVEVPVGADVTDRGSPVSPETARDLGGGLSVGVARNRGNTRVSG